MTEATDRLFAHELCPEPHVEHLNNESWARYHLARAIGFDLAWWAAVDAPEDEREERRDWATMHVVTDAHLGFLYLHGTSVRGIRQVLDDMGEGDAVAQSTRRRLRELGVDWRRIKPYETRRVVREPEPAR